MDPIAVFVSGGYAYVRTNQGLQILNVSNPRRPIAQGSVQLSSSAFDERGGLFVSGSYAYLGGFSSSLQIVDVSNPASPVMVGARPMDAERVIVSGSYAYVAAGSAGLRIIDVSDPASPTEVGFFMTSGNARSVALSGTLAFVAADTGGLRIIDVSSPASPSEVGFTLMPGAAEEVRVSGSYAYVTCDDESLRIVQISNPTNPVEAGSYTLSGDAWMIPSLAVAGSYVYLRGFLGLHVVNISAPSTPTEEGIYQTVGYGSDVFVSGPYTYTTDREGGLYVLQFPEPAHCGGVAQASGPFTGWLAMLGLIAAGALVPKWRYRRDPEGSRSHRAGWEQLPAARGDRTRV